MTNWPLLGRHEGPIVMIGFGSIGRGALPLILRHIACDVQHLTVIDPDVSFRAFAEAEGVNFLETALTPENYREVLHPLMTATPHQALIVNLSVDVSSLSLIEFAREMHALYIDTVIEPWAGHYTDLKLSPSQRSNYALREELLSLRRRQPGGTTAVSCCGANPGMVSWFVKQALLNLASDLGCNIEPPATREDWACVMRDTGVKGIHIAERDTQCTKSRKPIGTFVNTWSVDGFISEGLQPAELGWGVHEKSLPPDARLHDFGCGAAIYLSRPGAGTRVRSWTPTSGAQIAWLITHNESISIADYFTLWDNDEPVFRPTCHYAYHPCDDAVLSLYEMAGSGWQPQQVAHVLEEDEILHGIDELGVLLYGHRRNAYWYGSQLSIEETRTLAPNQNATGLQVTSAVLAGIVWALENPQAGIVEADEMDFRRCLEIQRPYLGPVIGSYTDWTPLDRRGVLFPEDLDHEDPWQFQNVLVQF